MNKNVVIFILVVFTLLGSIWGSVANKKRIILEQQLLAMAADMEKIGKQSSREREQVLGKTAGLQESLAEKEGHLQKARKELVILRKSSKAVESKLSECTASLQEMNVKKEAYMQEIQAAKNVIASLQASLEKAQLEPAESQQETVEPEAPPEELAAEDQQKEEFYALQDQLQSSSLTVEQLREELSACSAQIIGLEKLVDEKNAGMEETTQEMDRLKINMDVLLSKIADQRDSLQELQEENREMGKDLAAKNEEIADLQEEMMQTPVQQE